LPALHTIEIKPLPLWMNIRCLLGDHSWALSEAPEGLCAKAQLERKEASLIQARLRGLGFNGHDLDVTVSPKIPRPWVREARTMEARARRDRTPGFETPGVKLDEEGKYSLTPESLALMMGQAAKGKKVLDAGCGAGGNTIGFARAGCDVLAVESSEDRLNLARHNAHVFGVQSKIDFLCHDVTEVLEDYEYNILFVDPPWGREYDRKSVRLSDLPLLESILSLPLSPEEIWLKLPPSFCIDSLPAEPESISAVFGNADGDRHRVKFIWVRLVCPPRI